MNGIRITICVLIIAHILPIAITQSLILGYPFNKRKTGRIIKLISTIANVLLNSLSLYVILTYSKFDIVEIISLTCSYQDISRLATSNIISLTISVLIGIGIHTLVCKLYRDESFLHLSGKCLLFFLLAAVPIILGYYYGYSGTSHLAINEICRKTTIVDTAGYLRDEDVIGDEDDESAADKEDVIDDSVCYVVVINNGILACELDQLYLSDNRDELRKQQSSQRIEIRPGETHQFYMLNEGLLNIKKSGGTIVYLSDKFRNIVDAIEVPALAQDEIYKNMETGWQVVSLTEERGTEKEREEIITVAAPSFSQESGFYDEAFELELTADPGTTIYYTIDSSNPTIESMEYSGPIHVYDRSEEENRYRSIQNVVTKYWNHSFDSVEPVDKCFVVRAAAVDNNGNFSDTITKSYFVNQNKYKDRTVISLVSDPKGLFDDEYGIYVTGKNYDEWYLDAYAKMGENGTIDSTNAPTANFFERGIAWERESNLEVFENANLLLTQPIGVRIQGNAFRDARNKRFSIYARDEYSSSDYFDVNLINDYRLHSVLLRIGQGGNLHVISQMIGQDRDVATTDSILVDVFLDGEFWYTTYLFEKFNERNFSEKYNLLSKDNIVIYKAWGNMDKNSLEAGKNPHSNLQNFIEENDLSNEENYLKYSEMLDIQSYIDWLCINTFLQNRDYAETANTISWHTITFENEQEGDTRWRFGLYDMDLGWTGRIGEFDGISAYEINPFSINETSAVSKWPIYLALKKNAHFCRQFVLTFMDLINTNLSVNNTKAIMEKLGIENEGYQIFFENRADYIVPYMAEEFELTGTQEKVTLSSNVSGTPITLNTISPELQPLIDTSEETMSSEAFLWTGDYFTDYPVTVTADNPDFSYWEVTADGSVQKFTDKTIEVPVSKGGVQIHAVFK